MFITDCQTLHYSLTDVILRTVGLLNMTGDEGVHSDSIFKSLLNATIIVFRWDF